MSKARHVLNELTQMPTIQAPDVNSGEGTPSQLNVGQWYHARSGMQSMIFRIDTIENGEVLMTDVSGTQHKSSEQNLRDAVEAGAMKPIPHPDGPYGP
jgi:hypothetical protein